LAPSSRRAAGSAELAVRPDQVLARLPEHGEAGLIGGGDRVQRARRPQRTRTDRAAGLRLGRLGRVDPLEVLAADAAGGRDEAEQRRGHADDCAATDELTPADLAGTQLVDQVVLDLMAAPADGIHPALGLIHLRPSSAYTSNAPSPPHDARPRDLVPCALMRIALAQLDVRLGDIERNAARARELIRRARAEGADLIVLPELSLSGYDFGEVEDDLAIGRDDPRLAALVAEAGDSALVVGFAESTPLHTYNAAAYFEGGALVHVHRKIYLPTYGVFEERKHFSPGGAMRAFDTRLGRLALLLCNDAWQPALAFLAVQDAAQLLLIPANSASAAYPGALDTRGYWRDITRFYGRMFESYVVFVNRVGREGELDFWGGSHVVDPYGEVLAVAADYAEDVLVVDVDLAAVRARRHRVPLVREARLGLIAREVDRLLGEGGDL
jgi:predicted amidohydrolase